MNPIPYPLSISFTHPEDLNAALQIEGVSQRVNENIETYGHLNLNTIISSVGKSLQLAYVCSVDHPCSQNVLTILSDFQDFIKKNLLINPIFGSTCLNALKLHKMAIKLAENGKLKVAFQILSECAKEAEKIQKVSQEMVDKALKLSENTEFVIYKVQEDERLTLDLKNRMVRVFANIRTVFANTYVFWSQIKVQCKDLTKKEICNLYMDAELKEPFIDEIKNSGLNWLALGKINYLALETLHNQFEEVNAIMSNLPTKEQAQSLIKELTEKWTSEWIARIEILKKDSMYLKLIKE